MSSSIGVFPGRSEISSWSSSFGGLVNDTMLKWSNLMLLVWDDGISLPNWIENLGLGNWDVGGNWVWCNWSWVVSDRWTLASGNDGVAKIFLEWDDFTVGSIIGHGWSINNKALAIWELNPLGSDS